jgi:hypothetical protein
MQHCLPLAAEESKKARMRMQVHVFAVNAADPIVTVDEFES